MDIFEQHCKCIRDLIVSGQVIPQVINTNQMAFRYRSEIVDKVIDKEKFKKNDFLSDLKYNIPKFLIAILTNGLEMLIRFDSTNSKENEEAIRRKVNIVEKYFIDTSLTRAFRIKSTSKNEVLRQLDWDISKKVFDSECGPIDEIKYANVSFQFTVSDEGYPFVFNLGGQDNRKVSVITVSEKDIDYLLMELTEIKKVLSNE